jgi:hypothetical protein
MSLSRLAGVVCFFAAASWAQFTISVPAIGSPALGDEQELMAATRARATAFATGDCKTFESYVSSDFMEIEGFGFTSHDALVKQCQQPQTLPGFRREAVRSEFSFKFLGNVAIVTYRGKTIEHFGNFTATESFRGVDTWEKRNGKWVAVWFVFVPVFEDPPAAKIDPATLDDFVGQYAWEAASGMTDTITRKGDKLYIQTTGDDAPTELIRESKDTFAFHLSPDRITFLRSNDGRVVEEHPHSPDGQGGHNERIK